MQLYDIIYKQADNAARAEIEDVIYNLKSSLFAKSKGLASIEIPIKEDQPILTIETYKAHLHIENFVNFILEELVKERREEIRQELIKNTAKFLEQLKRQNETQPVTINWTTSKNTNNG